MKRNILACLLCLAVITLSACGSNQPLPEISSAESSHQTDKSDSQHPENKTASEDPGDKKTSEVPEDKTTSEASAEKTSSEAAKDDAEQSESHDEKDPKKDALLPQIIDRYGDQVGTLPHGSVCTAVDSGIFSSVFEIPEGSYFGKASYYFFNEKNHSNVLLGTLEDQGYEAVYARTELNGLLYTLAISGNPMDKAADKLLLLAFDPENAAMEQFTVSENGFPYAAMAAVDGKLLIMNHEMKEDTAKHTADKLYEFDPASKTIWELLTFSAEKESLRGVCAAEDGFYLLRLRFSENSEPVLCLDSYSPEGKKAAELELNETFITAALRIHGMTGRQDALNEMGMNVSRFAVVGGRYLFYENFGVVRLVLDLEKNEAIFAQDDLWTFSIGNGEPVVYRLQFLGEEPAEPEIFRLIKGELVPVSSTLPDGSQKVQAVSRSLNDTWVIMTLEAAEGNQAISRVYLTTIDPEEGAV